jgi:hypothetical protein
VSGRIFAASRDLAIADREDDSEDLIGLDAADPGASAEPLKRDHCVWTGIEQLDRIEPEVVERVDPLLDMRAQAVLAMNRPFVAGIDPLEVKIVSPVLEPLIDPPWANAA